MKPGKFRKKVATITRPQPVTNFPLTWWSLDTGIHLKNLEKKFKFRSFLAKKMLKVICPQMKHMKHMKHGFVDVLVMFFLK